MSYDGKKTQHPFSHRLFQGGLPYRRRNGTNLNNFYMMDDMHDNSKCTDDDLDKIFRAGGYGED